VRVCCYLEAAILKRRVLERGVLERVPERYPARRVGKANTPVLMGDDTSAGAGELGDDLGLCDARTAVFKGGGDGAVEGSALRCKRWGVGW